jgi:hypothetical protein
VTTEAPESSAGRQQSDAHRKGRTGRFCRCTNCGRSPLIIRHCNRLRLCAVCEQCGHHQAIKKEDLEAENN